MKVSFNEFFKKVQNAQAVIFDRYAVCFPYVEVDELVDFIEISYIDESYEKCEFVFYESEIVNIEYDDQQKVYIVTVHQNDGNPDNNIEYPFELLQTQP